MDKANLIKPSRPKNAFQRYLQEKEKEFTKNNPELDKIQISKLISKAYDELS